MTRTSTLNRVARIGRLANDPKTKTKDGDATDDKRAGNVGRVQWNRVVVLSRGPNKRSPA